MSNFVYLNLETTSGNHIHINQEYLKPYQDELLEFLDGMDYMRNLDFAKSMMMSQELKSNNTIEGIKDDLSIIDEVIQKRKSSLSEKEKRRIINLYHGYQYILTHRTIDKESLRELYSLLSEDILEPYDKANMGAYYRTGPVFIGSLLSSEPFMGADENKIDYFMNQFFEFINNREFESNEIEKFIKSQIMHFYFVYIHPYFDVNGRTSRTVSMWYLLNNQAYPYIIFNRAIAFAKKEYEQNIIKGRTHGDITLFLKYMLVFVEKELEKEYLIQRISEKASSPLTREESQILQYLLTMKGNITVKDLATIYNNHNEYRNPSIIFKEKISPLLNKTVLISKGDTKSFIARDIPNIGIGINPKVVDIDPKKIKHITLSKYVK